MKVGYISGFALVPFSNSTNHSPFRKGFYLRESNVACRQEEPMKAKVEVIIEREETATEQLARGVEMADDNSGTVYDEIKKEVESALETEYDDADVRFVEEVS